MKSRSKPLTDARIRAYVRARLPSRAFRNQPWRVCEIAIIAILIFVVSIGIIVSDAPCYSDMIGSLALGNFYAMLVFRGHDAGHGAFVRSRSVQDVCLWISGFIFCVPPSLWRVWHNAAHHAHYNDPIRDPDTFGLWRDRATSGAARVFNHIAPGSGSWIGALLLATMFTLQGQAVLWLRRRRPLMTTGQVWSAAGQCAVIASLWIALGVLIGARAALFVILVPMAVANALAMSYIVTNHMVSPLRHTGTNTLTTTLSVRTPKIIDWLHSHFSHHVEHHLFPAMSSYYFPQVRALLVELAPHDYCAPLHCRALAAVLTSPRLYLDPITLTDPERKQRIPISALLQIARRGDDLIDSRERIAAPCDSRALVVEGFPKESVRAKENSG